MGSCIFHLWQQIVLNINGLSLSLQNSLEGFQVQFIVIFEAVIVLVVLLDRIVGQVDRSTCGHCLQMFIVEGTKPSK